MNTIQVRVMEQLLKEVISIVGEDSLEAKLLREGIAFMREETTWQAMVKSHALPSWFDPFEVPGNS